MLQLTAILCPVCGHAGMLANGPGGRPRAACRACRSLERHRALVGVLPGLVDAASNGALVDVAPSPRTSDRLKELAAMAGVPYVGMDFDPGADGREVTLQASLTQLPVADGSAGLLVCFHVLEHIPDDAAAMSEIRRVLAPGGVAVIQVPYKPGELTDEDPDTSPQERLERFGQVDHVRYYGRDFDDRLVAAGLCVRRVEMRELFSPLEADLVGVLPDDFLWLCTSDADFDVPQLARACGEEVRRRVTDSVEQFVRDRDELLDKHRQAEARLGRFKTKVTKLQQQRDRAVARERHLRARLDVRVVSGVARILRRLGLRR